MNYSRFIGETIHGHCQANGRPAPVITWQRNGDGVGSAETAHYNIQVDDKLKTVACLATSKLGQVIMMMLI